VLNKNPAASTGYPTKEQKDEKDEKEPEQDSQPMEEGFISCCFSFTIRRDKWGIPSMIVGNFIRC
jgi:hypothetical protein